MVEIKKIHSSTRVADDVVHVSRSHYFFRFVHGSHRSLTVISRAVAVFATLRPRPPTTEVERGKRNVLALSVQFLRPTNGHFSSPLWLLLPLSQCTNVVLLSREIFSRRLNFFTPHAFRNDVKAFARSPAPSASPLSVAAADADFVVVIVTVEQSNENSSFWPSPLLLSFPPGSGTKQGNGMRSQGREGRREPILHP